MWYKVNEKRWINLDLVASVEGQLVIFDANTWVELTEEEWKALNLYLEENGA